MKYLLIILLSCLTACSSFKHIKSPPEAKLDANKDLLRENATKMIEVAKSQLSDLNASFEFNTNKNDVKLKELKNIIEELTDAQIALGMKIEDQKKAKEESYGPNQEEYYAALKKKNDAMLRENAELAVTIQHNNDILKERDIIFNALKDDQFKRDVKFYSVIGVLVLLASIFGYMKLTSPLSLLK